mgnify:CR=1 FL=1
MSAEEAKSYGIIDDIIVSTARDGDGRAAIAWADDHATPGAQIYVTVQCARISATTGKAASSTVCVER